MNSRWSPNQISPIFRQRETAWTELEICMVGLWDNKGMPHKGWSCSGMEDLGAPDGQCEMCGKEEIRYVHFMQHSEVKGTISVGCVCAEKMEEEYGNDRSAARQREAKLKNAAGRRERWPALQAWRPSAKGNDSISKNGRRVVIFKHGSRFKFLIKDAGGSTYFSPRTYADGLEAKLAAFDAITYQRRQ